MRRMFERMFRLKMILPDFVSRPSQLANDRWNELVHYTMHDVHPLIRNSVNAQTLTPYVLDECHDILLRPANFAAYIALSAATTNCMGVVSSEGTIVATPTLIVTCDAKGEAGCSNSAATTARRSASACAMAASNVRPGSNSTNSSPQIGRAHV